MGAQQSCPKDFERGTEDTCRYICPSGFKPAQESSSTGPVDYACVSTHANDVRVSLTALPRPRPGHPEPPEYQAERDRVRSALKTLPEDEPAEVTEEESPASSLQSEPSRYVEQFEDPPPPGSVRDLVQTLKPLRPPTAPASDLAIATKGILESSAPNFLLIQVQLAIVVLCLLAYGFLPLTYAPGVCLLLLSVGAAVGIFLWK
jgi:hypothetical protein